MAETPEQVAARAVRRARQRKAPHILQKALLAAGLVETGIQHKKYSRIGTGDRDSVGWLQQRPSQGWGPPGESIEKDTDQFLNAGLKVLEGGFKGTSGQLAQAVQRSAFPAKYDQRGREAEALLRRVGGGSAGSGGLSGSATVSDPSVSGSDQGSAGVAALLQAAMAPQQAPQASAPLAAPAHSAAATTPQAYQQAPSGGGGPAPAKSIDALLQAVSAIPQSDTTVNPGEVTTTDGRSEGDVLGSMAAPSGGSGRFKITGPNPSRIQPQVRNFVQRVAGVHGKTIVGSDGTGHSKYTTSGNVSEHYSGSATDIPASGAELTRMGQAALVAAGWSPQRARKAKGGIYNVVSGGKRKQIIFNTREGGNHFDHLHVGVSGRRR